MSAFGDLSTLVERFQIVRNMYFDVVPYDEWMSYMGFANVTRPTNSNVTHLGDTIYAAGCWHILTDSPISP